MKSPEDTQMSKQTKTSSPGKTGNQKYRTSDLYYAAFLKAAGVPLLGTDKQGQKCFFIFEENLDDGQGMSLRELKKGFFGSTAKVVARKYADEIKAMKSLTFA
jgi:hypothetical protein